MKTLFFLLFFFLVPVSVHAQFIEKGFDLIIHAEPESTSSDEQGFFTVTTKITNVNKYPITLLLFPCYYNSHWVSDSPDVIKIPGWLEFCKTAALSDVTLKTGESFTYPLHLQASFSSKMRRIAFRLGYIVQINPQPPNLDQPIIWTNLIKVESKAHPASN